MALSASEASAKAPPVLPFAAPPSFSTGADHFAEPCACRRLWAYARLLATGCDVIYHLRIGRSHDHACYTSFRDGRSASTMSHFKVSLFPGATILVHVAFECARQDFQGSRSGRSSRHRAQRWRWGGHLLFRTSADSFVSVSEKPICHVVILRN
jgi:hypothetical protein